MDKRVNIFKILKNEQKMSKLLTYVAQEIENDPYEHTKTMALNQPISIDAFIREVSPEALVWRYYGQIPIGSKEIICEKKYLSTIKSADRITINGDQYKVRKDDSKGFAILERQDYIVAILEKKVDGN